MSASAAAPGSAIAPGGTSFDAIMAVAGLDRTAPSFAGAGLLAAAPAARRVRAPVTPPAPEVGGADGPTPRMRPRDVAPPPADAPRAPTLEPRRHDLDGVLSVGPLLAGAEQVVARSTDGLAPLPDASSADPQIEAAPDAGAAAVVLVAAAPAVSSVATEELLPAMSASFPDATEVVATLAERVDATAVLPASVDVAVSDPLGEWSMSVRRGADGIDVALSGDRAFAAAVEGVEQDLRRALGAVGQELRSVSVREDRVAVAPTASASASSMGTAGGGAAPHGRESAPARVAEPPVPGARNRGAPAGPSASGSPSPALPRRGVLLDRTA